MSIDANRDISASIDAFIRQMRYLSAASVFSRSYHWTWRELTSVVTSERIYSRPRNIRGTSRRNNIAKLALETPTKRHELLRAPEWDYISRVQRGGEALPLCPSSFSTHGLFVRETEKLVVNHENERVRIVPIIGPTPYALICRNLRACSTMSPK